jgi:hypothetical protein
MITIESWEVKTVKKHNLNDYYHVLTLKDSQGNKIPCKIENLRHLVADCDKSANFKGL